MNASVTDTVTVHGWKAIAAAVEAGERTVRRWARRPYDPLPVRLLLGEPWALTAKLVAWRARHPAAGMPDPELPRIVGLAAVGALLGCGPDAVREYARSPVDPLPVQHLRGGHAWAYEHAIRDWIDRRDRPLLTVLVERKRHTASERERERTRTGQRSPTGDDVPIRRHV